MNTDPIADLLTRIRNSVMVRHPEVCVPASKMKASLLNVLRDEGFITGYERVDKNPQDEIKIILKYVDGMSVIRGLKKISKPSCRVYRGFRDIRPVQNGMGVAVVSTSQGVLSDRECRGRSLGGEVLFEVW